VGDLATTVRGQMLVGFENHGGLTVLGEGVEAYGDVIVGRGNDGRVDGFRAPRLVATYAHGPVLAQNPWLADELLSEISGRELVPWPSVADRLYGERCALLSTRRSDADRTVDRR
jgi:CobQ-like glutamine amidotransferase family enzyme